MHFCNMNRLNFPLFKIPIKNRENKKFIFDFIRKKWLLLTPEEWVRQNTISYLIKLKNYPKSHIKVEGSITINNIKKRYDIIAYNKNYEIDILIECKSPTSKISRKVFDQIALYNLTVSSKYLMITNGIKHYFCQMDYEKKIYLFIDELPNYNSKV